MTLSFLLTVFLDGFAKPVRKKLAREGVLTRFGGLQEGHGQETGDTSESGAGEVSCASSGSGG